MHLFINATIYKMLIFEEKKRNTYGNVSPKLTIVNLNVINSHF